MNLRNSGPVRQPEEQHAEISDNRNLKALAAAARATLDSGDPAGALDRAEELLELFPGERQGFILKTQALIAQGRLAEALETINEALDAHPDDPKLLSFARNVALQDSRVSLAAKFAQRLSRIAPHDLKNEVFLIDWHLSAGQPDIALARADALIEARPEASRGWMLKAGALINLQRPAEALQVLNEALPRHSSDAKFLSFARNLAFDHGAIADAEDYASRLLAIAPEDQKNRVFIVQCSLATGAFERAFADADALVAEFPDDVPARMLRAQALVALHRVGEALQSLEQVLATNPDDRRLLHLLRNFEYQNGRFGRAADHALRLTRLEPDDDRNKAFLIHAYKAAGRFDAVADYLQSIGEIPPGVLLKEHHYFSQYQLLKERAPVFASAWEFALQNSVEREPVRAAEQGDLGATMIQYWSQGTLPDDVQIVCNNWKQLFEAESLGAIELFDRTSATKWIADYAPEFSTLFSKAFHYAMESDIFRIAYASRRPCIYMDIDSWPLEHTAAILRFAVRSGATMLYLRAHRATIVNGFFVSQPDCPFVQELVRQCLAIELDGLRRDYLVLESTFGPSRYSKVFMDLLASCDSASATTVDEVPGCSSVSMGIDQIYFAHEAAVAAVRPPFALGYKATDDYWKFISLPELE